MRALLFLFAGFALVSCDNSIDLFGPEVETPVVWCLLDLEDSVHFLRLQRSFQSYGQSALISSQDPDKIYFPDNEVDVFIQEKNGSGVTRNWVLERVLGDTLDRLKEVGLFVDSPNVLYRFKADLLSDARYELAIKRMGRDSMFKAETSLVKAFPVYYPGGPGTTIDYADTGSYTVQWVSAEGGQLYDGQFELIYEEFDGTTWQRKRIQYPIFGNKARQEITGFEVLEAKVNNIAFFTGLRNVMGASEPGTRQFVQLNLFISAGGEEMYLLYLNNLTALGITSLFVSPIYSNISDGLGIFSSRKVSRVNDLKLTTATLDSLACGRLTRHLGFARPPAIPGMPDCP